MTTIRTFLARLSAGLGYALAPKGSELEAQLRPIWRPGQQ